MGAPIVRDVAVHGMTEKMVPVAGIEPATFGLQVHPATAGGVSKHPRTPQKSAGF